MNEPVYETMNELVEARRMRSGGVMGQKLTAFNCKNELFIQDESGRLLFRAYYGTNNACEDICALLNISMEHV